MAPWEEFNLFAYSKLSSFLQVSFYLFNKFQNKTNSLSKIKLPASGLLKMCVYYMFFPTDCGPTNPLTYVPQRMCLSNCCQRVSKTITNMPALDKTAPSLLVERPLCECDILIGKFKFFPFSREVLQVVAFILKRIIRKNIDSFIYLLGCCTGHPTGEMLCSYFPLTTRSPSIRGPFGSVATLWPHGP